MSNIINFHRSLVKLYKLSHMRSNRPFFNKYYNKKILDKFYEEHNKYADNLVEAIEESIDFPSMKYLLDMCISLYTLTGIGIIDTFNKCKYVCKIDEDMHFRKYQMQLPKKNNDYDYYITLYINKNKPYINNNSMIRIERSLSMDNLHSSYSKQLTRTEYNNILNKMEGTTIRRIISEFRRFYFDTIVSSIYQDIIKNVEELEQLTK